MSEYDPLNLKNQLCFPLYAASREIIKRYRPFLEKLDLTYTQYIAMMVFWEERRVSAKTLGERLLLDSGTLTPVLKSLETKGLICRTRSHEDERLLIAELTPQGEALREQAIDIPAQIASCVLLKPEEAAELYRLLYKILDTTPSP